jgi:hypothetical protein
VSAPIPATLSRAEAEERLCALTPRLTDAHVRVALDRAREPRRDTPIDQLEPQYREAAAQARAIIAAHAAYLGAMGPPCGSPGFTVGCACEGCNATHRARMAEERALEGKTS